jgi:hypothetical protein
MKMPVENSRPLSGHWIKMIAIPLISLARLPALGDFYLLRKFMRRIAIGDSSDLWALHHYLSACQTPHYPR